MEEYFPPHGTDHQIMEGQEAPFWANRLAIVIGSVALICCMALGSFLFWQQRVSFLVPDTELMATLPKSTQHWLKSNSVVSLTDVWKRAIPESDASIVIGGDATQPTWMIAPIWVREPASFTTTEQHGLYRLSSLNGAKLEHGIALSPHAARAWLDLVSGGLGGVRVHEPTLAPEPLIFSWNRSLLKSSLPYRAKGTLSAVDDVSYTLQNNRFDDAFLQSGSVNKQGLTALRHDLERVSWTGEGKDRSWEFIFTHASSVAMSLLSSAASSTVADGTSLRDGSGAQTYKIEAQAETDTSTTLRIGTTPTATPIHCSDSTFIPFLRMRGQAVARPFSIPFIQSASAHLIEVGSIDNSFAVCFE